MTWDWKVLLSLVKFVLSIFITEVPCPADTVIQVLISEPDLTCEACDETIDIDQEHQCEG